MMKSVLLIASLLATSALSKPLHVHKRHIVTIEDIVTITVTATGSPGEGRGWGNWGTWQSSTVESSVAAAVTTTWEAPAPPSVAPQTPPPFTPPAFTPAGFPPPAATTATAQPPTNSGSVSDYAQAILDQHNNHRANHTVPDLSWSDDMASIAQQIAASCVYAHNTQAGGGGYGQNIGAGAPPNAIPALITNEMYDNEIGFFPLPYGQSNPSMSSFENWGHFSQIVWKSTTSVGCYTQYCPGGLANTGGGIQPYFTVCNYSPPGNFGGEYGDNVLPPTGMAPVIVPS